jgi:hypothetical protein
MSEEQRREGLAQIHDIRRRLASMDFSDIPDDPDDGPDAEVIEIIERKKKNQRHDPDHPVMVRHRADIDG